VRPAGGAYDSASAGARLSTANAAAAGRGAGRSIGRRRSTGV
jgi:hypothetical protein